MSVTVIEHYSSIPWIIRQDSSISEYNPDVGPRHRNPLIACITANCSIITQTPFPLISHPVSDYEIAHSTFYLSYYVIIIDQFTQTLSSFQNPDIFISSQIRNMGVNLTLTSINYMQLFADIVKLFIFIEHYIFVNPFKSL